jgi:hypothetical protein
MKNPLASLVKSTFKNYALVFFAFAMMGTAVLAQSKEATSLSGYVIGYDANTKQGCFFVDKDMVAQGIAKDISNKTNDSCSSPKYGLGAAIGFNKVPTDADYTTPAENTLMIFQGHWVSKDGKNTFIVNSFQPFF